MNALDMLPGGCQIHATVAAGVLIDCGYTVRLLSIRKKWDNSTHPQGHCVCAYMMGGILWIYDANRGTESVGRASKYNLKTNPLIITKKLHTKVILAKWKTGIL